MSLLTVSGLSKAFGGVRAVDGVDLVLTADTTTALIGPNGAGKTTLFNLLGGQLAPDAGSIAIDGAEIAGLPARARPALGVARGFQVARAFASMTASDNLVTVLLARDGHIRSFSTAEARGRENEARALLARVGLAAAAATAAGALPYGDLKRLELALALALKPRLLLLDEPTAGIGGGERRRLMELIGAVAEPGIAVLFSEHDMDAVFGHADRVVVLHRGRIIADGAPGEVRADATVRDVYLGHGGDV